MLSGYEVGVGFTERKFLILVSIKQRKMSETFGARTFGDKFPPNGY
jgi:hypothetical protein